jgi:hypothetical protein
MDPKSKNNYRINFHAIFARVIMFPEMDGLRIYIHIHIYLKSSVLPKLHLSYLIIWQKCPPGTTVSLFNIQNFLLYIKAIKYSYS